jgi:hypothetical protein
MILDGRLMIVRQAAGVNADPLPVIQPANGL